MTLGCASATGHGAGDAAGVESSGREGHTTPCLPPGSHLHVRGCSSVSRQAEPWPEINMRDVLKCDGLKKKKKRKNPNLAETVLRIQEDPSLAGSEPIP